MLSVPDEFKAERKQSVSHSFGSRTLPTETCLWFHFLCKDIDIKSDQKGKVWLGQNKTYGNKPNAAEDYAYVKSGFVINCSLEPGSGGSSPGSTTLVCFGATPNVRSRLDKFTDSVDKELACTQPYLFFAPILSGLHADLDDMAWNLNEIFANDEAKLLTGAYEITKLTASDSNIFASLHYLAKYCFVLLETATSLQLVTETIISQLTSPSTPNNTALVESLQHTLTLIHSTHLRLTTLRQRIKNAIALAFNLNADKDTKIMMDDSHAMRVIAFMTAFLLPATAIASILGSNMFDSSDEEGTWTVRVNAAFWMCGEEGEGWEEGGGLVGRKPLPAAAAHKAWFAMQSLSLALIKLWLTAECVLASMRGCLSHSSGGCCAAGGFSQGKKKKKSQPKRRTGGGGERTSFQLHVAASLEVGRAAVRGDVDAQKPFVWYVCKSRLRMVVLVPHARFIFDTGRPLTTLGELPLRMP
ncbi:hypothetical protein B0T16DRAFT_389800 [Cercophora newfieldiana]|uniref:Uncharacterized protein n=1 Tax=Cercophora newfieldiana TaxID=92897 RepID=A0AA40CUK2_9PEZI|nr:hypothetical protein B0T16DRAFT_389800 [Cercophora newfieldiana]